MHHRTTLRIKLYLELIKKFIKKVDLLQKSFYSKNYKSHLLLGISKKFSSILTLTHTAHTSGVVSVSAVGGIAPKVFENLMMIDT